jgi:hypothetical protein
MGTGIKFISDLPNGGQKILSALRWEIMGGETLT